MWHIGLLTAKEAVKEFAGLVIVSVENVSTIASRYNTLVDMHGTAWLMLHWLGHKRCKAIVLKCCFADQALIKKYLIGECYWITMLEVDLDLPGTTFLNNGIDFESLSISEIINIIDNGAVFLNC